MTTTINIFRHARDVQSYTAGETIFRAGERGDLMYVVVEGTVDIYQDEQITNTLGPDELFGEMALIDDGPRSATAIARTDCTLARVNEAQFVRMVHETPYFALNVMRVLVERLRVTM